MFLQRMVRHLAAFALFAFLATPSMASAQDVPSDTPQDAIPADTPQDALPADTPQDALPADTLQNAADSGTTDETVIRGHGFQLGMSFLGVPGYFFNPWFAKHGSTWDGVVNMGVSLDYFLRFQVPCELRFTLSWFNARTGSTYWLDDDHKNAPHLAHYIVNQLSSVNIEIAAYHIVPIIDEISFYYGGGLWGGVVLGDIKSHAIRSSCALSGGDLDTCPHEPGSVSATGLPPVFGFVMVTLGFKFTLMEWLTIRAEGGFKGYFYGQLGLGVEF